ncbi:photosynthesis system II assembly factor Ycf48 [Synechocystis sp. CACIAM 05]|uniref:photosynthesis system II assembly factor Ycf48 n=1 Tax=Synechocystis sp. CACIAM 05 TaxID=1933929 RepID=UPI00138E921A|nr:photosynthesis system II assembly factor Ycf48 [Synechocystis sp. CACIAM 05]QHU99139.1 photosystem II assembly protein [Synechocystis sp. CACIAM 05]
MPFKFPSLKFEQLKQLVLVAAIAVFCVSCSHVPDLAFNPWQEIALETDSTFADIAFTEDPNHGWLVGTKETIFETTDGGDTWEQKLIDLGEEKASFSAVSFSGNEGWITGKPSILLHTTDGGQTWARIPLSEKLPGAPYSIIALGPQTAEMITDLGAIYKTTNGGKNWKALVEGAVGVARTIQRSPDGRYVAVSARGNFYSTWAPGQTEWTPHNRNSSRRLQTMGYGKDGQLWLLARGGQLQFSTDPDAEEWSDVIAPQDKGSWGLLDLSFRTPEEVWVAGASGNLLMSQDGGQTWAKDTGVEDIPANLYRVVFLSPEKGFVLGQDGILLKYNPSAEVAMVP